MFETAETEAIEQRECAVAFLFPRPQPQRGVRQHRSEPLDLMDRRGYARNRFTAGEGRSGSGQQAQRARDPRPEIDRQQ